MRMSWILFQILVSDLIFMKNSTVVFSIIMHIEKSGFSAICKEKMC
jgi:hypothetical protein